MCHLVHVDGYIQLASVGSVYSQDRCTRTKIVLYASTRQAASMQQIHTIFVNLESLNREL